MNVHLITMLKVFVCLTLMGLTGITIGGVSEAYVYAASNTRIRLAFIPTAFSFAFATF